MKPLLTAIVALPLLAACATIETGGASIFDNFRPAPSEDVKAELPAAVAAVMPTGTSPSIVMKDANGCYIYSIEKTTPQTGFLVRDAKGNPICEGETVTQVEVTRTTPVQ